MSRALTDHIVIATSFREDAPRPPVPGEEGEATPRCYNTPAAKLAMMIRPQDIVIPNSNNKSPAVINSDSSPSSSSSRRNQDGLGEPEGSASPDSPLSRWTKSLHSLLGDQDGALLFRTFLEREKCADTLDFWFACNGFRRMDPRDGKTQRVARAIYKRYVDAAGGAGGGGGSVVAGQLKPATKTFIRDGVKKQQIDSAMFDQAQTEVQGAMEESAYRAFLSSDIFLDYVRTGGESGSPHAAAVAAGGAGGMVGDLKVVCGYLPTLNEEEEWSCGGDFRAKALVGLRASVTLGGAVELMEKNGYRSYRRGDPPVVPVVYHAPPFAPASSTNDSEVSSDALTDDAMSVTDSSVDGVPPYKLHGNKKLIQRHVRINSQGALPAFPRTRRPPKDMVPVDPPAFAAQLISRLERLKRERDTMSSLEERLQQIQEEEERDESEACLPLPHHHHHPLSLLSGSGDQEDNAQAILDEHLSRVLKTPGCQSPTGAAHHHVSTRGGHSPLRSASPERHRSLPRGGAGRAPPSPGAPAVTLVSRQSTKHIHHHYIHHHHPAGSASGPGSKEQMEREATLRVQQQQGLCPSAAGTGGQPYQRSRSLGREMCGSGAAQHHNSSVGRSSSLSRRGTCRSGAEEEEEEVSEGPGQDGAPLQLPCDPADRSQNVWQWILESERQGRHKSHSTQSTKKSFGGSSSTQTHTWGGGGSCGHLRGHQPAHPFIQDPAMPPLPPPNTLAQLEEACRRLEEVSTTTCTPKTPKTRHASSSLLQRDKIIHQSVPVQSSGGSAPPFPAANPAARLAASPTGLVQSEETKECKKSPGVHGASPGGGGGSETVVTYFFCGEEIPYRRSMKSHCLTLGHFKETLRKKGHYRYYFKKASDEFECGAVFEEVSEDGCPLPTYQGKILGKVERME